MRQDYNYVSLVHICVHKYMQVTQGAAHSCACRDYLVINVICFLLIYFLRQDHPLTLELNVWATQDGQGDPCIHPSLQTRVAVPSFYMGLGELNSGSC